MDGGVPFWILLLTLVPLACCASEPGRALEAVPAPELDALFRNSKGWVGADGHFTVSLDRNTVLWLFSDTFVGEVKDGRRVDCTMINNSIAIQRLGAGGKVEFFYRQGEDGRPKSFVTPDDGEGYFWLFGGALTRGGLYIFLLRVKHFPEGGGFPFKTIGMSLAHVPNPQDPPERWTMTQRRLPFSRFEDGGCIIFGSAVMIDGGYVYIYGLDSLRKSDDGKRRNAMVLARVPVEHLGDFDAWRFYSGGKWVRGPAACDALCDGLATEYSVCALPGEGKYAAVYTEGGIFGRIVMRLAPRPEGPWGEPIKVFDCPDKDWHKHAYSYAAKVHPELSTSPGELIITYATNSTHFPDLFDDARLYWPRFVRLKRAP